MNWLRNLLVELDPEYLLAAQTLADLTNVRLPETYYRFGLAKCWSCTDNCWNCPDKGSFGCHGCKGKHTNHRKILVFDWPLGAPETPEPRPITLALNPLAGLLNTCPYCSAMQGPHRLHHCKYGPFFHVKLARLDTQESFVEDINLLAASARKRGKIA